MNESDYIIRRATTEDIPFIAKVIVEAEKSGTDEAYLAKYLGISNEELYGYVKQMLEEEVGGCELSLSSFIVAEYEGEPVSAEGGWIEGYEDDMPSALLKSNLLGYVVPKEILQKTRENALIARELQLERTEGTLQLEYAYTEPQHRGNHLIQRIKKAHIEEAQKVRPEIKIVQEHIFENNKAPLRVNERMGFHVAKRVESNHPDILTLFPHNVLLLLEKIL